MNINESVDQWGREVASKFMQINYAPAIPAIREVVRSSIITNFTVGGRFGSGQWGGGTTQWQQSNRAANKDKGQTLRHKGLLLNSIRVVVEQQGNKLLITVGSNQPYAAIHQFGYNDTQAVREHTRLRKGKVQKASKKYGRFAQQSISIGKVKAFSRKMIMPARPYLVLQDDDIQMIQYFISQKLPKLLPR